MDNLIFAHGLVWNVRPGTDDYLGPNHEPALDGHIDIPSGGVFFDVGAHVGHFTVRLAQKASYVVAFEPGPKQIEGLKRNLDLNQIRNVMVAEFALWDNDTDTIEMTHPAGEYGHNGHFGQSVTKLVSSGIPCHTLDVVAETNNFDRIDFIKIDVQGAEGKVLRGAKKTIAKFRPKMMVELHHREFNDDSIRQDVEATLTELGYKWTNIHSNVTNDYWICEPVN